MSVRAAAVFGGDAVTFPVTVTLRDGSAVEDHMWSEVSADVLFDRLFFGASGA